MKFGFLSAWLMVVLIFEREYSTDTAVIGAMPVPMWAAGATDLEAALPFIGIVLVAIAIRIGERALRSE